MPRPDSDSDFTTDVARFYQDALVPLIFEPYAARLADLARATTPCAVLEVACGTGVVTRALATHLASPCSITATDLNHAMVAHAESIGTARPVTWERADASSLPYPDARFDLVVCQFAVMFFPDRRAAYREIRRVLRPGGTFLFNVWNPIEDNDFAAVVTDALGELFPGDRPEFLARTPHGYHAPPAIEADLVAAGFTSASFTTQDETSAAPTPEHAALAYCQGTPLRGEIEARRPGSLEHATDAAAAALRSRFGDGAIEGRISAVVVTAT